MFDCNSTAAEMNAAQDLDLEWYEKFTQSEAYLNDPMTGLLVLEYLEDHKI